jgi:anti-sigma factor RsiW
MDPCNFSDLNAYLDDELPPAALPRVQAHLQTCVRCARRLRRLRDATRWIETLPVRDLTPLERARAHRVINEEIGATRDAQAGRIAWTIGTIAASILVMATAWLNELPAPAERPRHIAALADAGPPPAWEQVALTLQVEPPPLGDAGPDTPTRLADARFAGWMLDSLDGFHPGDSDAK